MATTDNHETSAPLQGRRLQLVTFLVTGSMFMEVLDGNIIATALPQMGRSFGVDALELSTAIGNVTAQSLYESMGWQRDVEFHTYSKALKT